MGALMAGIFVLAALWYFAEPSLSNLFGGASDPTTSEQPIPTEIAMLPTHEKPTSTPGGRPASVTRTAVESTATSRKESVPAPSPTLGSVYTLPPVDRKTESSTAGSPSMVGTYIDVGTAEDVVRYSLQGFGPTETASSREFCALGGFEDRTSRAQEWLAPYSSLRITVIPNTPVIIRLCMSQLAEGDTWNLSLGGDALSIPECTQIIASQPNTGVWPAIETTDDIVIEARCVPSDELVLAFTDRTQFGAAVWGMLVQQNSSPPPTVAVYEVPTIAPVT